MWTWNRNNGQWKSKYFLPKEFQCTCGICSNQKIDEKLIGMLDEVREIVDLPIRVTSGFRCSKRQDDLRKQGYETAAGPSSHEFGQAADLSCSDMQKLEAACKTVFDRYSVGVAKTFVHVDIRAGGPRRWSYK